MLIRTMLAICIMIFCGAFSVVSNFPGMKESVNIYHTERIMEIADEKILNYYCHNSELPSSLSSEFLDVMGLESDDVSKLAYSRSQNGRSYTLSLLDSNGTVIKSSQNSGRVLPEIPGYIDRTLTGGEGN